MVARTTGGLYSCSIPYAAPFFAASDRFRTSSGSLPNRHSLAAAASRFRQYRLFSIIAAIQLSAFAINVFDQMLPKIAARGRNIVRSDLRPLRKVNFGAIEAFKSAPHDIVYASARWSSLLSWFEAYGYGHNTLCEAKAPFSRLHLSWWQGQRISIGNRQRCQTCAVVDLQFLINIVKVNLYGALR
jgi:hypothetical protein